MLARAIAHMWLAGDFKGALKRSGGAGSDLPSNAGVSCLADPQVFGRRLALVWYFIVADFGALVEAAEACSFDGRNVDEDVLSAVIRLDKSIALRRVEPLYCTHRHVKSPIGKKHGSRLTEWKQKKSPLASPAGFSLNIPYRLSLLAWLASPWRLHFRCSDRPLKHLHRKI